MYPMLTFQAVLHGRGELDAHSDLYHAPGLLSYILVEKWL